MSETDTSSLVPSPPLAGMPNWLRGLITIGLVFLFVSAVKMMGGGLKVIAADPGGEDYLHSLFSLVDQPVNGLFVGLLVTSLVQSSSFTTSMTIGFVAGGQVSLAAAIPIIMGANIGTSVTNILVSLAHIRQRREFRRSFAGAIVHDFFNVLSVLLFLPLEWAFGIISKPTQWFSEMLAQTTLFQSDPTKQIGFLKGFFGLLGAGAKWLVLDVMGFSKPVGGTIVAAAALVLLVKMLRGLMQSRLSDVFDRTLFRRPGIAFMVGIILTASVQSSSVTTSLVVPLVGAGILKLRQIYPYTLGANIGTTLTAMLAAVGTGKAEAMGCAMGHLLFNFYGTAVFWPLQFMPISLAKGFAKLASRRRLLAAGYVLAAFFVVPIVVIILIRWIQG